MRGVLVFVVLMSSVASADEAAVRPARFHPSRCEVSGTKFVTPRQLEQELSWNAGLIKLCHELDDPAQLATELKSLLEKAYHAKGFGEVAITVTPKPDDRLRIEISEGARFKRGPIEFVGAKQVDTKRLALWMGQIVPKEPQPIVLAVNEAKQPTLQRLPNGHLRRESPTDVASQLADPDKLAQELEKLPFVPSGAVATSEQKVAPSKLALIAAGKLEPSVFSVLPLPQVLPKQASIQTALKLEEQPRGEPLWVVNGTLSKNENTVQLLEKWLPLGFADQGFSRTRFRVEIVPQSSTATVLLKVVILDEGPVTQVQAIEMTGLRHNSRESVLERLDLKVGQRIDATRAQSLEEELADSGRFLLQRITISPADDAGNATAYVDLREPPKGPTLDDKLSDDQQLLLRAAHELNRWSESQNDLVLSARAGKDAPRDGSWSNLDWTAVVTRERVLLTLRSFGADGRPRESWLMVGDGLLEFASSSLRQRGRLKFAPSFEASVKAAAEPDNPAVGAASLKFDWAYKSWLEGTHQFRFQHEPSVWLTKPIDEMKSLDESLTEVSFVPKMRGAISEKAVIDRGAGRFCSYAVESKIGFFGLEPRRGAFVAALAEARLNAADFEDVTSKPFPEAQFAKLVLQALDGAGLPCPGLSRDQQRLAASWLKRLDIEHVGNALMANSPKTTNESVLGAGVWPLAMHLFSSATQTTPSGDVANTLRPWLALSQFAAGMTATEPIVSDSGLAEQLRFETIRLLVGPSRHRAIDVLTNRDDYGPLAGLLGATNMLSDTQDPTRQFAARGIERIDHFDQERQALLTPGTMSHTLAILLVEHLRQSPAAERELISSAFEFSDAGKVQAAAFWQLLDQAHATPTTELLPSLVDAIWSTGLKDAVSKELEQPLLGDLDPNRQLLVLLNQARGSIGHRRFSEGAMWLDRAEATLLKQIEMIPLRRRTGAIEDARLTSLSTIAAHRAMVELGRRDFEAAYKAAMVELSCCKQLISAIGDGPAIDDFAGTLTKRGQALGRSLMAFERLASVEWHRSGRDEALKWLTQAETLAREFESKDAPADAKKWVALPLVIQSLFWAYADKAGRRDPQRAMALAKRAYEWGGEDYWAALDAVACAYAADGKFEEALDWTRRADLVMTDATDKPLAKARLKRFLDRKLPDDEFLELMTAARPANQAAK